MTDKSKKTALFVGGAVLVGSVGFFVWSFFRKPSQESTLIQSTSPALPVDEENPSRNWEQYFSNLRDVFSPITAPISASGFNATLWNSVKN